MNQQQIKKKKQEIITILIQSRIVVQVVAVALVNAVTAHQIEKPREKQQ